MCGRVFNRVPVNAMVASLGMGLGADDPDTGVIRETYNGAPGQTYGIIVREYVETTGRLITARWGILPQWAFAKGIKPQINARAETIRDRAMFRASYRSRRALLPISGYYEWMVSALVDGKPVKQPYAIAMADGSPFTVAAIWATYREGGVDHHTFAVVTCEPNAKLREIHDRMPVIVAPDDRDRWLNPEIEDPGDLMRPFPSELIAFWPVSTRVNSTRNDTPDLLDAVLPQNGGPETS